MQFEIDDFIKEKYSGLKIATLYCSNIKNVYGDNFNQIDNLLSGVEKEIVEKFESSSILDNKKIVAWRDIHKSFGSKPKKYNSSIESLCRCVVNSKMLNRISPLVDLYNFISLKYLLPAGGDDLDKVDGRIRLTVSKGDEKFNALNSSEITYPKVNEVIYKDDVEVLCRRWNWRECNKSKFTENTTNAILFIEALDDTNLDELENISKELCDLVIKFCGGDCRFEIHCN